MIFRYWLNHNLIRVRPLVPLLKEIRAFLDSTKEVRTEQQTDDPNIIVIRFLHANQTYTYRTKLQCEVLNFLSFVEKCCSLSKLPTQVTNKNVIRLPGVRLIVY